MSSTSLEHYDRFSKEFADDGLRHPADNLGGSVVWGTRYYLESLLTAYQATGNPKYIQAFLDSGAWVLNLVQTLTVLDVPDPSAPGRTFNGPLLSVTGWPTAAGSFGVPVAIPTKSGQIALYTQSLGPGAIYFEVNQQSSGALELSWVGASQTLETNTVRTLSDLEAVASESLKDDPETEHTPGRIVSTGLGLPVPGKYEVDGALTTMWQGEQSGGILMPFVRFLVLAKDHPELADQSMLTEWKSKILSVASDYEDQFVSDGSGGLRIHNPVWLPNSAADTDAPADYIYAEATMRLLLYELTKDSHQLSIAKGLVLHQRNKHWSINPKGWLVLRLWPCLRPWSTRREAPAGSIWDALEFDPSTPEDTSDAGFFVELLHEAKVYGLAPDLGLTEDIYLAHRQTFQRYLRADSVLPGFGPSGLLRGSYPGLNSTRFDPVNFSPDPFVSSGFLASEVADQLFINANWNWMLSFGRAPVNGSGYFLRAWARSEAAELSVCQAQKTAPPSGN